MEVKTVVFKITKVEVEQSIFSTGFNITSEEFDTYNKYGVNKAGLFEAMEKLKDTFRNVVGCDIVFEI